jgi:hypothetical protein
MNFSASFNQFLTKSLATESEGIAHTEIQYHALSVLICKVASFLCAAKDHNFSINFHLIGAVFSATTIL